MEIKDALDPHCDLPPDYYERSIKTNPFQRFWHTRRFRDIGRLVEPVAGEILDIGCADGTFTKIVADRSGCRKITGIDILEGSVNHAAKKFAKDKRFKFLVADAHELPFKNNQFEAVFCLEALEHIINPQKVLSEIKRVLKPRGYLIILVPTDNRLFKICWWVVLNTWGKHWRGTHIQSFSRDNGLAEIVRKAGFQVEKDQKFLLNMLEAVRARKL